VLENVIPPAQDRGRRLARSANGAVSGGTGRASGVEDKAKPVKPVTSPVARSSGR
jgi:hypothetical protein